MQPPSPESLAHIPAAPQAMLFGNTFEIIKDPIAVYQKNKARFGDVYRVKFLGEWRVSLTGADALEFILMDPDKLFSSEHGWNTLEDLFPRGLMLLDFDEHRAHRRIMQAAFRKPAMDSYLEMMAPALDQMVAGWPAGETFAFYPAIKDLTLRMGANVFMGLPVGAPETADLNRAFVEEIAATLALLRTALPMTKYRRGMDARRRLIGTFAGLIEARRGGHGEDFFSRMCRAQDEDGTSWTDEEIVDHFNFLMMAAHDTTASALTAMIWALSEHPDWQERLAREVDDLGDGPFEPEMLDRMPATDMVFREALRMMPPVPLIPRRAVRDFEWKGVKVPAGSSVTGQVGAIMMSPDYYTDPQVFDPERFSPNRAEDRSHKFAWAPFGGGAHKCIGLHFSSMQVKAFLRALLRRYRIAPAGSAPVEWKRLPIPQPKGGLPVVLTRREGARAAA